MPCDKASQRPAMGDANEQLQLFSELDELESKIAHASARGDDVSATALRIRRQAFYEKTRQMLAALGPATMPAPAPSWAAAPPMPDEVVVGGGLRAVRAARGNQKGAVLEEPQDASDPAGPSGQCRSGDRPRTDYVRLRPFLQWAIRPAPPAGSVLLYCGRGRPELCGQLAEDFDVTVLRVDACAPGRSGGDSAVTTFAESLSALSLEDSSADVVVDVGALDWAAVSLIDADEREREQQMAGLRAQLLRVLKPGARLSVVTALGGTSMDPAKLLGAGFIPAAGMATVGARPRGAGANDWSEVAAQTLDSNEPNLRCYRLVRAGGMDDRASSPPGVSRSVFSKTI